MFASLRPIIVVDLLGLEKLTNGFGLILLFQGLGAVAGAPLAGDYYLYLLEKNKILLFLRIEVYTFLTSQTQNKVLTYVF